MSFLSLLPATRDRFDRSMLAFTCGFEQKGILTSALGPFILGCGMTLAGAVRNNYFIEKFEISSSHIFKFYPHIYLPSHISSVPEWFFLRLERGQKIQVIYFTHCLVKYCLPEVPHLSLFQYTHSWVRLLALLHTV